MPRERITRYVDLTRHVAELEAEKRRLAELVGELNLRVAGMEIEAGALEAENDQLKQIYDILDGKDETPLTFGSARYA